MCVQTNLPTGQSNGNTTAAMHRAMCCVKKAIIQWRTCVHERGIAPRWPSRPNHRELDAHPIERTEYSQAADYIGWRLI